jgi:ribose-phosphate pyrophosphokinase
MKLMTGNSNIPLFRRSPNIWKSGDGGERPPLRDEEVFVEIHENVRGEDVFVIQPTSYPRQRQSDGAADLHRCAEALVGEEDHGGASLFRLCAAGPEAGAATPISAKLVANLITVAGANRVLSIDLPCRADTGLLRYPHRQSLCGARHVGGHPGALAGRNITVVSPDVGGVVRARALAKRLNNAPLAIVDKRRERPGESEVMNIIGDVSAASVSSSTTSSIRQARSATPPRRCGKGARRKWSLTARMACFRALRCRESAIGAERSSSSPIR